MNQKLELAEFAGTAAKREKRAFRIMLLYSFFSAIGLFLLGLYEANFAIGIIFAFLVLTGYYIVTERPYEKKAYCPTCGEKLVDKDGLLTAFRHCPNCDFELFGQSHAPAAFPDKKSFPPTLSIFSGSILAAAVLFPVFILLFWRIGICLHGTAVNFPDNIQIIFRQLIVASTGLPVAAGLLLLVQKGLESRWNTCLVCGEKFSPNLANASGNCSQCGAVLLETFPVAPDTVLPSRINLIDYRRITSHFTSIAMLLPLIIIMIGDYFDNFSLWLLEVLCATLLALAAGKIYAARVAKRMNLSGRCPSCNSKIGIQLIPRCPRCGRRTIKEVSK